MKYLLYLFFCTITFTAKSQQIFIAKGKIEFEKQLNLHKEIDESWDDGEDNIWKQNMKKMLPKVQTTYYDLFFDDSRTLYKVGKDAPPTMQKVPDWMQDKSLENIILNDVKEQKTITQKSVFEDVYLIKDSIRKIDWRITSDTRTIAGIECRKAIGKIMDSVYVIAFYTDLITTSGGPESFTGLPGMILGVAIPRINTTWFATKVELIQVKESDIVAPKKGKQTNWMNLSSDLKKATKDWGKESQRILWNFMI
jgi:GLPGLI family protein